MDIKTVLHTVDRATAPTLLTHQQALEFLETLQAEIARRVNVLNAGTISAPLASTPLRAAADRLAEGGEAGL